MALPPLTPACSEGLADAGVDANHCSSHLSTLLASHCTRREEAGEEKLKFTGGRCKVTVTADSHQKFCVDSSKALNEREAEVRSRLFLSDNVARLPRARDIVNGAEPTRLV